MVGKRKQIKTRLQKVKNIMKIFKCISPLFVFLLLVSCDESNLNKNHSDNKTYGLQEIYLAYSFRKEKNY